MTKTIRTGPSCWTGPVHSVRSLLFILEFLHSFSGSSTLSLLLTGSKPGRRPSPLERFTPAPGIFPTTSPPFEAPGDISCSARSSALLLLLLLIENTFFFLLSRSKCTNLSAERRGRSEPETRRHICVLFQLTLHPPSCRGNLFSATSSYGATDS